MIVHVAGVDLTLHGTHVRQRCGWCGYVLIDVDLTRVAVQLPADGSDPPPFPTWEAGALVAVDGAMSYVVEFDPEVDKLTEKAPEACMLAPPELTLAVAAPDA